MEDSLQGDNAVDLPLGRKKGITSLITGFRSGPSSAHFPDLRKPVAKKGLFIKTCLNRMNGAFQLLSGEEFFRKAGYLKEKE
jgi:hypothetical protein